MCDLVSSELRHVSISSLERDCRLSIANTLTTGFGKSKPTFQQLTQLVKDLSQALPSRALHPARAPHVASYATFQPHVRNGHAHSTPGVELQTPSGKLQTSSSKRQTPNSKLQASNSEREAVPLSASVDLGGA